MAWEDTVTGKAWHREYREKNREKLEESRRLRHVKRYYGLTADQYLQLILDQKNKCAICNQEETCTNKRGDVRPLCVDHDHETNEVRGLLCNSCNAMLGNARDSISKLLSGVEYLKKYKGEWRWHTQKLL